MAGSLPWGVLLTFINDYLHVNQRLSTPQATLVRAACLHAERACLPAAAGMVAGAVHAMRR